MPNVKSRKYLLAIDPGLATGIALINTESLTEPSLEYYAQLDIVAFYEYLEGVLEEYADDLMVVCEAFIITVETAKKTPAPWSLELIGLIRYMCWKYEIQLTMQKPGEREFATKAMLKHLGFVYKVEDGHSEQAMRHGLVWIVNRDRRILQKLINVV